MSNDRICKNCNFRKFLPRSYDEKSVCTNPNITEQTDEIRFNKEGNKLLYSDNECGEFYVEDNFGCVHFWETAK